MVCSLPTDVEADPAGHVGGPRPAGGTRRVAEADAVLSHARGAGPPLDTVGPTRVQQAAQQCQTKQRFVTLSYVFFVCTFSVKGPGEPCAPGSTQPLKMSTRDFSWGEGGWCVRTTCHPRSAERHENPGP